jgi:hypothetical protein
VISHRRTEGRKKLMLTQGQRFKFSGSRKKIMGPVVKILRRDSNPQIQSGNETKKIIVDIQAGKGGR